MEKTLGYGSLVYGSLDCKIKSGSRRIPGQTPGTGFPGPEWSNSNFNMDQLKLQ